MTKTPIKSLAKSAVDAIAMVGYGEFLNELKVKIRNAQMKAAIAASKELIELY